MPTGEQLLTSSSEAVQGSTTEKTFCSRMRRAMSCVYCAPKSRMTMDSLSLDWGSTDEFLKSAAPCKEADYGGLKLRLYSQVRSIAQNRFLTVDSGLGRWRQLRNWDRRRRNRSVRHFCDADIPCQTRHVQPIHNRKIDQRHQKYANDHQSPGSDLDKGERRRYSRSRDAERHQVRQPGPCAHGKHRSGPFSKEFDGSEDRAESVFAVADHEHAAKREPPVQDQPRDADQSSQREENNEHQAGPGVRIR